MKLEPNICPVCWAMQNPADGTCLVCGEKYHVLDIPFKTATSNDRPFASFLMPLENGFIVFDAEASLEVRTAERHVSERMPFTCEDEAVLTLKFIPEDDTNTLFKLYLESVL